MCSRSLPSLRNSKQTRHLCKPLKIRSCHRKRKNNLIQALAPISHKPTTFSCELIKLQKNLLLLL